MPTFSLKNQIIETVAGAGLAFKEVAGAADLKAILSGRVATPGCYVFRERNAAKPNTTGTQFINQARTDYIGLLVVTRSVADAKGGASADENEDCCHALQELLLGYVFDNYASPLEYASGRLIMLMNGLHYWQEIYYSTRYIRSRQ